MKVQRRDYCSVKRCTAVLPSVTVRDKYNSGEISVERKLFGADRKCKHTIFFSNNLTGRATWKT